MKVGLVYDPIYLEHYTGQHVENAGRLEAVISYLEQTGLKEQLTLIKPRAATTEEISLVHHHQYIAHIQEVAEKGGGWLDPDTVTSTDSFQAAVHAAGGAISASDAVMSGEAGCAFALVRPPGHHATHNRAMGFCLFNNIAIATKHALAQYGLERILIIDSDVHHGNGTQAAFYDNPKVLYLSIHESPFYPGTGRIDEIGSGTGEGTTINVPLPAGCGDSEYLIAFEQIVVPAVRRFNPQLIMVSIGYDLHWADELALMEVSTSGLAQIVRAIKGLADELCHGRMVFCLEGGYHLQALACSVKATFDVLLGKDSIDDPLGPSPQSLPAPSITHLLKSIKAVHKLA